MPEREVDQLIDQLIGRGIPIPSVSASARKAALSAVRGSKPLQMPVAQELRIPPTPSALKEDEEDEEELNTQRQKSALLQQAMMSQRLEMQDEDQDKEKKTLAQKDKRAAVRNAFKKAMRRGFIYLINLIAVSLDFGVAGISFIITCSVYLFSLVYINLEMIYGTHIAKGKSKIISPTSWFPIPMPVDPNAIILQSLIITADIAFAVAVVIIGAGGMCILHDYTLFASSPISVGKSIAGGGGDLCLGGIISLMVNGL